MLPKYHQNYLKLKETVPEHTDEFQTKGPNDIVIIYSRFEDLFPGNKEAVGGFIPQWVGFGIINDCSGFCNNFSRQPSVCQTYKQMTEFALKKLITSKIQNISFCYKNYCVTINEMSPFQTETKIVFDDQVKEEKIYVEKNEPKKALHITTTLNKRQDSVDSTGDECSNCKKKSTKIIKCIKCPSLDLHYCCEDCLNNHQHDCLSGTIQHLNNYMLEKENDVIITYTKFEHLHSDEKYIGYYVPQWISTDLVSETRGIHSPLNEIIVCQDHNQMKKLALSKITKEITFKPRRVYFYYVVGQFVLCNTKPFKNDKYFIYDNKMVKSCNFCGKYNENKMLKCGRCRLRYYCDQKCQKSDWTKHKLRCK